MHARNADHARGIIRKLENERKHWILEGVEEVLVDAYFGPKLTAAQEQLRRLESRGAYEDQDVSRYVRKRKNKEGHRVREVAHR